VGPAYLPLLVLQEKLQLLLLMLLLLFVVVSQSPDPALETAHSPTPVLWALQHCQESYAVELQLARYPVGMLSVPIVAVDLSRPSWAAPSSATAQLVVDLAFASLCRILAAASAPSTSHRQIAALWVL